MQITGKSAVRIIGATSPVAGMVEIHSMSMQNGVMKMFQVDGIDVPAGKTVKLAPGGYHVMLMGLKQQMKAGDKVALDLLLEFLATVPEEDRTVACPEVGGRLECQLRGEPHAARPRSRQSRDQPVDRSTRSVEKYHRDQAKYQRRGRSIPGNDHP